MITIFIPGLPLRNYEFRRGDSQIIHDSDKHAIVIDGGEPDLCNVLIAYCRNHGITHVTYILTHWHIDHDKGMESFLNVSGIFVDCIYCPPPSELKGLQESGVSDDYNRALRRIALAEKLKKTIIYPKSGVRTEIKVGDIRCQIWRRAANKADNNDYEVNNTSLVTYFPDIQYLTTGDTINSFDIYLNTFKDPVTVFKIPHHGNAATDSPCKKLKNYGAKLCWYNDFEPKGTPVGGTGFSKWGAGYCKKYFETLRTDIDVWMIADKGKLTVTKGTTNWTFDVPYRKGQWEEHDQGWKYNRGDGTYYKNGTYEIDGKWYFFDAEGYRIEGWVKADDDIYRYCNPYMYTKCFFTVDGKTYYVDGYGRRLDGWHDIDSKWYCFDNDGVMQTGWYDDPELGLRYLEPSKGYMYVSTQAVIDGKSYYFDGYGRVTEIKPSTGGNSPLVNYTKLSPNNSGKRTMAIDRITPHCAVGQVSVESLGNMFATTAKKASCNYGIGSDGRVLLCVDEDKRSWCSSSAANDQRAVTIECASDATSPYAFNTTVYNKLVDLCVDICQRNGKNKLLWIPDKTKSLAYMPADNEMVLTVHRWFAQKACPGDWMYARMGDLASKVTQRLGGVPKQIYRVRKSWTDVKSQIGAFTNLDNAKALAAKNPGYYVFDEAGNKI